MTATNLRRMKFPRSLVAVLLACILVRSSFAVNPAFPEYFTLLGKTREHSIWRHVLAVVGPKRVIGFNSANATLLAPTDKAFRGPNGLLAKLGVSEAALKKDTTLLTLLVKFHTLPLISLTKLLKAAEVSAGVAKPNTDWWIPTLVDWDAAANLNGQSTPNSVRMFTRAGKIAFRGAASSSAAKIPVANTDLFVLGTVLLPRVNRFRGCKSPVQLLQSKKAFVHLTSALKQTGLYTILARLDWDGTLFAPTDAAFRAYAKDMGTTVAAMLRDKKTLERLVLYHASRDRSYISNMQNNDRLRTFLDKQTLTVDLASVPGKVILEAAESSAVISSLDLFTCKAVIHPAESILVPA